MKINTDVFQVSEIKKEGRSKGQRNSPQKTDHKSDTITISVDKKELVTEENKSAAQTGFKDIKRVEEAVFKLNGVLSKDIDAVSDIHQLGRKSIVTISQE